MARGRKRKAGTAQRGGNSRKTKRSEERPAHGVKILRGLETLREEGVFCDVVLVAEEKRFPCHRNVLASCSDYFRSMFTIDMKESKQTEIEIKEVTARGLEKTLEVTYTSTTVLEDNDIFDLNAAANYLQVTPVIEFCEDIFLRDMNVDNFMDIFNAASKYDLDAVVKKSNEFIAENLQKIGTNRKLALLSFQQMKTCLQSKNLCLPELDIFQITWDWLLQNVMTEKCDLLKFVRFHLISPGDLAKHIQTNNLLMSYPRLRELVFDATNYHMNPHSQPLVTSLSTCLRSYSARLVAVAAGVEGTRSGFLLHDEVQMFNDDIMSDEIWHPEVITNLPAPTYHMQVVVFENFLYVLGGCNSECKKAESATNAVFRFDPRFKTWFRVCPMQTKRAYFFAGVLENRIYAVGGMHNNVANFSSECYDPATDTWEYVASLPAPRYSHAGAILHDSVYVSGGYANNQLTGDMLKYNPLLNQWSWSTPMLKRRCCHGMCSTDFRLFVMGGASLSHSGQHQHDKTMECFNSTTNQWHFLCHPPPYHKDSAFTAHGHNIFAVGGADNVHDLQKMHMSRFDANTELWTTVGKIRNHWVGFQLCVLNFPCYGSK